MEIKLIFSQGYMDHEFSDVVVTEPSGGTLALSSELVKYWESSAMLNPADVDPDDTAALANQWLKRMLFEKDLLITVNDIHGVLRYHYRIGEVVGAHFSGDVSDWALLADDWRS